jgi:hypothetical protein
MGNPLGILFTDKNCTVRLWYEDNQSNVYEWWWEEPEEKTVFILHRDPGSYPGVMIHRMKVEDAQVELDKLLSEGWVVSRRMRPVMLRVPPVELE